MSKDNTIFLQHILESIQKIEKFTNRMKTRGDFARSEKTQDAVIRRLEIIGEATKNLSKPFLKKHPDVRWSDMARMRDKLIHHYFGVDLTVT